MRQALDVIAGLLTTGRADAETLTWAHVRYPHAAAVRSALAERYAPAMANKALAALRGVLKEAWRLGLLAAEDYHRAVDLPRVRGETLPAGRSLASGELRALFDTCRDGTPGGARDAALLAILYGGGLRRAEAVALDLSDYDREAGALAVHRGKGGKARKAYLPQGGQAAMDAWLAARGDAPGPLLCPVHKGGQVDLRAMTAQAVLYAVRRRAKRAGIARFSPHDLRRTFVGDLLDAGADIATVQKLAGHASVQTTARYDRRGEVTKRKAALLLHVPFVAPKGEENP